MERVPSRIELREDEEKKLMKILDYMTEMPDYTALAPTTLLNEEYEKSESV